MVGNITFLMIFAVLDPSPLTLNKLQFLVLIEIIIMNNHNRIISSTAGHSTTNAPWRFFALFVACCLCNSRDFGALCAIRTVANVTVEPKITGRARLYITRGT